MDKKAEIDDQYELGDEPSQQETGPAKVTETLPEKVVTLIGTVEDVPAGTIKNALVKLNVTDASLAVLRGEVDELLAKWDGSKAMYELFKTKRNAIVRGLRTPVKAEAEAGRAEALAVQRLWIGAEKAVTGFYSAQEDRLKAKEIEYETKLAKEAEEKARVERERVEGLFNQLKAFEWPGNALIVAQMTDEQFTAELAKVKAQFEEVQALRKAEAERKAKEEKEAAELAERNKAEAARLAKVAEEQKAEADRIAMAQKVEQDRLDAAAKAQQEANAKALKDIEDAKAAALKEVQDAKDKAEAERKAAQDEVDRKERERLDAIKKAENEANLEKARAAAAPDIEKLNAWLGRVRAAVDSLPEIKTPEIADKAKDTRSWLLKYC